MADQQNDPIDSLETGLDLTNLYEESTITDRQNGLLRIMTPLTAQGLVDASRPVLYLGETQVMTQMGPVPVSFEIKASSREEAIAKYGEAAKQGIKDFIKKVEELRRQAATQIVTPGMPGFQAPPAGSSPSGLVMP